MESQLSYFKSWKMMLWKCCTQYASKFGKLINHKTGKDQFSFQYQRKAMPKNAQTTAQLHSSHTLVKYCSKFSRPGFSNTWTMNFQMFNLVLEKAEEPEIKLPTSAAAAAAKSLQSCPTLCDPIDGSPPGSSVPWILQARTLEWVARSSKKQESSRKTSILHYWLCQSLWLCGSQ